MEFIFAQPCGAQRPVQKENGAHVNAASLEKTNKNKNIEYRLLEHLVTIQHRVTGAGAADAQQQKRMTQDHGSPP